MAKDRYFFDHDYTARNDDKILELRADFGAEGYGIFWMIVETMAENENGGAKASLMGGLSHGYGVPKDRLIAVVEKCLEVGLFYEIDGYYFSKRMLKHKTFRKSLSVKGKEGAEKRWKNGPPISPPNAKQNKTKQNKTNTNTHRVEGVFSQMPVVTDFNGLPEIKIGSAIQLIKITQGVTVGNEDILALWEVFKVQNLTGKKFYPNEDDVYSHFINWVKEKKIKQNGQSTASTTGKTIKFDNL
jgi:uncharacterized protein DUF4373